MALADLLERLEQRTDTPDTPRNPDGVSAEPAPILACTPVTPDTPQDSNGESDTPKSDPLPDDLAHLAELDAWPLELLRDAQHVRRTMRPCDVAASLAEFRRLVLEAEARADLTFDDDRRTCRQCANLDEARCLAAWRGEIVASRNYEPVRDLPRRCEGYVPSQRDPMPRQGYGNDLGEILEGAGDGKATK